MKKLFVIFAICFLHTAGITPFFKNIAQSPNGNTSRIINFEHSKAFIENKGQFDGRNRLPDSKILFAVDNGAEQIFFTKTGLTYRFDKKEKNHKRKDGDKSQPKVFFESDLVNMRWENANPDAKIVAEEKTEGHHSYSFYEDREVKNINYINGYKKLIYKNVYPNIDVEYVFHPQDGLKYSLILHPGADISQVKIKYDDNEKVTLNNKGEIRIATKFGDIIDHPPLSFYSNNKENIVESKFVKNNNTVSFSIGNYNKSKTIIIDPWVQTPTLVNSNGVWECEKDGAGNVYIIGGDMPMKLLKYNAAGAWQWTYNTPWDTANYWLGTLATDLAGNSYVTAGSLAKIQKVDASGGMVWSNTGGSLDEYWHISFNCDQTKLVVGGTRLSAFPPANSYGMIFDISTGNGNITDTKIVANTRTYILTLPPPFGTQTITDINEVRSISSSYNARYYFLTLDTLGAIDQNLSACPSAVNLVGINHTYSFGYKCENYRPENGNAGICAIKANRYYVYTQNGTTVHKRSLTTGAILTSAAIPGGISTSVANTTPTINQPGNSGIDIDSCGNVYVGSGNAVIKYDSSLNFITSSPTSFAVFDVAVSYNGDVIVCGATGTSSSTSRTGYVQSINMSACNPMILFCCDANICPAGPYCTTDAPVTLTAVTAGGTWSGTGITNATTGTFDPSVAGTGTFTIVYTIGCGSDSITITVTCCGAKINPAGPFCITDAPVTLTAAASGGTWSGSGITNASTGTFDPSVAGAGTHTIVYTISGCGSDSVSIIVNPCAILTACQEINGNITVSNGTGPYTWYEQTITQNCSSCFFSICDNPPGCTIIDTTWTSFATGTTVTPPSFPILIIDAMGDSISIPSLSSLPFCSGCTLSSSTTSTGDTCAANIGSATAIPSGGTTPYTYLWSTSPSQTTQTATGLSAGTYTVIVTDSNSCSDTVLVIVNSNSGTLTLATSQTDVSCNGACDGTATANHSGGTLPYS